MQFTFHLSSFSTVGHLVFVHVFSLTLDQQGGRLAPPRASRETLKVLQSDMTGESLFSKLCARWMDQDTESRRSSIHHPPSLSPLPTVGSRTLENAPGSS